MLDLAHSRYEREFGAAQRPIVQRIQEHDSSPSLPMVLCVSAIHRRTDEGHSQPYLELTDGWYRISAEVDACLVRAVDHGRIRVGRKLAISGAKVRGTNSIADLSSNQGDGEEVLNALEKSRLIISGNSSALARWDVKLGLQPNPFFSGLSSLSVNGGIISLMDVVVEKVFPLAFITTEKNNRTRPWERSRGSASRR